MLKATCAYIIAAAALIAVPVSAQTTDYGASTSMSTDTRGTTGTGDQYMRTQENYTESYQEQSFESSTPAEPASEYNFTQRDDDYQAHPQGDQRYSHSQEWRDTEDARYHMHQVVEEEIPERAWAVLSGPSFAAEVAENQPTAVTVASLDAELAARDAGRRQFREGFGEFEQLRRPRCIIERAVENLVALKLLVFAEMIPVRRVDDVFVLQFRVRAFELGDDVP